MKIAAYQGPSPQGDPSHAFAKIDEILAQAAKQGAQMVVFPELYLLGYNQMHRHAELAQPVGDDWEIRCAALAQKHKCGLTIGWAERDGETLFNSASTFDASGDRNSVITAKFNFGVQPSNPFLPSVTATPASP